MAAEYAKIHNGAYAVVLGQHYGETAQHVLKNGQTLLDMVLAVHAQLCGAAAGGDDNGLVRAGSDQGSGLYHGMGGACAETTGIGTGGGVKAGYFRNGLGKVAAAALVHIAASFFAAIYNVFNVFLVDAGILYAAENGDYAGSLADKIFKHGVRGKVDVYVVCAIYTADQHVVIIQAFGMLLGNKALYLGNVNALVNASHDAFVDYGVGGKLIAILGNKVLVQLNKLEYVAGLQQQQELFLGHHLAELAVTLVAGAFLIVPGLGNLGKFIGGGVADINLVGIIRKYLFKAAEMTGQLLEVLALRINYALGCLCGAVMDDHIGGMYEYVTRTLDYALHVASILST